ncbi:hypothetical protein GCM10022243_33850 [Saccharothrix violaceirubra]
MEITGNHLVDHMAAVKNPRAEQWVGPAARSGHRPLDRMCDAEAHEIAIRVPSPTP